VRIATIDIRRFRRLTTPEQMRDYARAYGPLGTGEDGLFQFEWHPSTEPLRYWRDMVRVARTLHEVSSRSRRGEPSTQQQRAILTGTPSRPRTGTRRRPNTLSANRNPVLAGMQWPNQTNASAIVERDRRNVAAILNQWVELAHVVPDVSWFPNDKLRFRLRAANILGPLALALIDEIEGGSTPRRAEDGRLYYEDVECAFCHELFTPTRRLPPAEDHFCTKPACRTERNRINKARSRDRARRNGNS